MLAGSEIIILTAKDAKKLLAACGFLMEDSSHTILGVVEDRFVGDERLRGAHDAALAVIELRDIVRRIEEGPVPF